MKRKLSKSNVSSHEINGFHEIQHCMRTKSTHSHANSREHSTRVLKFKLEAALVSSTVHVRLPYNVGGWRCWFKQVSETIGLLKTLDFVNFGGFRFLDPPDNYRATRCVLAGKLNLLSFAGRKHTYLTGYHVWPCLDRLVCVADRPLPLRYNRLSYRFDELLEEILRNCSVVKINKPCSRRQWSDL